jgi:hypothetical protein
VLERLADADLLIAIALATFIVPSVFLVVLATAAVCRQRGRQLGDTMLALLAFTGGLSLGTLLLFADDISLALPLLVAGGVVVLGRWRARRRVQAGWFLLGVGLPLVLVGLLILFAPEFVFGSPDLALALSVGAAALAMLAGLALVARGDPAPLAPAMDAPAGQPGSRSMGSIAAAIREPSFVGPFGMPEMAMLIAFIAAWVIVPIVLPPNTNGIVVVALASIVGAVLGTEAYIRAMTTRSRRAFEAFSWLGEWELARAHSAIGGELPTSPQQAVDWLSANPEGPITLPEQLPVRIEILLFAERIDEARAMLERLPTGTPWERFEHAALRDLVDWRAGGDGDLAGMREAAAEIQPRDGDDRLRAEVTIAVARVRRLMAEGRATPDEAVKPFLEVRELLGSRADGQVGRALRPRIIPGLILAGIALGIVSAVLDAF